MKTTSLLACLFVSAYPLSAYAKGGFANNFAYGFSQSATPVLEARAKANAEADANNRVSEAEVDILANQYQHCFDTTAPDMTRTNAFIAAFKKSNECETSLEQFFLRLHPDTPAAWFITNKPDGVPATHTATTREANDLKMLIFEEKDCSRPVVEYSGKRNAYITTQVKTVTEARRAHYALMEIYIKGTVTRGELMKRRVRNWNTYQSALAHNVSAFNSALDATFEERKTFCDQQLAQLKEAFSRQDAALAMAREQQQQIDQQNEIARLRKELDDTQSQAIAAEMDADRARKEKEATSAEAEYYLEQEQKR